MRTKANENLLAAIRKSKKMESVMIWGAGYKSDEVASTLIREGVIIYGYIDRDYENIKVYNGYSVYPPSILKEKEFFVYVSLRTTNKDIIDQLESMGYQEYVSYWYPGRLIKLDGTQNYQDLYGNVLETDNTVPINVCLRNGGEAIIRSKRMKESTKIVSEGCSKVDVGEKINLGENVVVSSTNGKILIGDCCRFDTNSKLRTSCGGEIHIGNNTSFQYGGSIVASFNAKVIIDVDCMVSYYVCIRAGNSHNMIDLNTLRHFDDNNNRDVILGKHVWVGMRATIMNGVTIGDGSMVGANSFVNRKKFPSNCCLAGNPAKIHKARIAWIRDGGTIHKNVEEYLDYIFE